MITESEIREKLDYYKNAFYSTVRSEQMEDYDYYNDTFRIPWLQDPIVPSRTGGGRKLVDKPVYQLSAGNLVAYREQVKPTEKDKKSTLLISKESNGWIKSMRRQNPDPVLEFLKNLFIRGEAWLQPIHNQKWVTTPVEKRGLPVLFKTPDPIIVYANPKEDDEGIPEDAYIYFEMMPTVFRRNFPELAKQLPVDYLKNNKTITWMEYYDKNVRYWEASGIPVLKGGIQPNPYGVPFIHKVSGFGKESYEGKPEHLIVSYLRGRRDLIARYTSSTSDIDSIIHLFANKDIDVQPIDDLHNVPENFRELYARGYGNIHEIPFGITVTKAVEDLPAPQVFEWNYAIRSELEGETPSVFSGNPVGGSGRQQDITRSTAMKEFSAQVKAVEDAFATGIGKALKLIEKMPGLMPEGLTKADIGKNYDITISLKDEDPVEKSRLAADGDRKYQLGIIDLETNLVKYQGYTQDAADRIMAAILVDDITRNNPIMKQIMSEDLAREIGAEERYEAIVAQAAQEESGVNPTPQTGSQGGEPRTGTGTEMADVSESRPPRRSPGA